MNSFSNSVEGRSLPQAPFWSSTTCPLLMSSLAYAKAAWFSLTCSNFLSSLSVADEIAHRRIDATVRRGVDVFRIFKGAGGRHRFCKSGRRGLNPTPLETHSSALPSCAAARSECELFTNSDDFART